jgi:subtilisin family serine protease
MLKLIGLIVCLCAVAAVAPAAAGANGTPIPGQYIVVLKDDADVSDAAADHRRNADAQVLQTYGAAIRGYAARVSEGGLGRIKSDPRVDFVMQDREGQAAQTQTLPAGINRIEADLRAAFAPTPEVPATPGDVAIFDSGIELSHPDLNVAGGVNCLGSGPYHDGSYNDQYGHGTHVAGIVGAKNDGEGVVGVAPGVRLWSVRTLNQYGGGSASSQLCGIDWITANAAALGIKVVNSSQVLFGKPDDNNCGYTAGDAMHKAICQSVAAGITWLFGAANTTGDFKTVAGSSYDEVLTVTGMGDGNGQPNVPTSSTFSCRLINDGKSQTHTDDKYGSYSKYSTVDNHHTVAAPGACVYSTWKGNTYGHATGTSMASPHAAAVTHLCIIGGQCTGTPAEIIQKIRSDAAASTLSNSRYGFAGDPLRPVKSGGKTSTTMYFGYLVRADLY